MKTTPYIRQVHYYETDQMSIVHHSNYIRWFEEARLDHLAKHHLSYKDLEERGIIIPVVDISCKYLFSARYADTLQINVVLTQYTGVRMTYHYEVLIQESNTLAATGTSTHCFLDKDRRPISIKRKDPELHALLLRMLEPDP